MRTAVSWLGGKYDLVLFLDLKQTKYIQKYMKLLYETLNGRLCLHRKWWDNNLKTFCGTLIHFWEQENFSGCHPMHDKILCWPPTRRNSLAIQPCFKEYNGVFYSIEGKRPIFGIKTKNTIFAQILQDKTNFCCFRVTTEFEVLRLEIIRILIVIQIEFSILFCDFSSSFSFFFIQVEGIAKLYSWADDKKFIRSKIGLNKLFLLILFKSQITKTSIKCTRTSFFIQFRYFCRTQ